MWHPALRVAAGAVTHLGDTLTRTGITVVAVAALGWRRAYRSAVFIATVVPLGGLIDTVCKVAADRAPPGSFSGCTTRPMSRAAG